MNLVNSKIETARVTARHELRRKLRDRGVLLALLVFCCAYAVSLWISVAHYRQQTAATAEAHHGSRLTVAAVQPEPVSILSSNLTDVLYVPYDVGFPVYSIRTLGNDGSSNLLVGAYQRPDPSFTIAVLGSIFALFVACDSFAVERETRRLSLLLSYCGHRQGLLWGKMFGAWIVVAIALAVCGLISVAVFAWTIPHAHVLLPLTEFFILSAIYMAIFVAAGTCISARSNGMLDCAGLCLALWIILVVLLPLLGSGVTQQIYSASSPQQVEADLARERTQNQNLASFAAAKLPPQDERAFARLYEYYEGLTNSYIYDRETRYQEESGRELRVATMVERLSPSSCFRLAAMQISHTGFADLLAARQDILRFKRSIDGHVLHRRAASQSLAPGAPVFILATIVHRTLLPELFVLLAYGLLSVGLAQRYVRRLTVD
ncbi:MAG: ABC transporter permease [Acidobacteriia bacterium]|nr:ABC transporter permease [Terriglobia bacterium]